MRDHTNQMPNVLSRSLLVPRFFSSETWKTHRSASRTWEFRPSLRALPKEILPSFLRPPRVRLGRAVMMDLGSLDGVGTLELNHVHKAAWYSLEEPQFPLVAVAVVSFKLGFEKAPVVGMSRSWEQSSERPRLEDSMILVELPFEKSWKIFNPKIQRKPWLVAPWPSFLELIRRSKRMSSNWDLQESFD